MFKNYLTSVSLNFLNQFHSLDSWDNTLYEIFQWIKRREQFDEYHWQFIFLNENEIFWKQNKSDEINIFFNNTFKKPPPGKQWLVFLKKRNNNNDFPSTSEDISPGKDSTLYDDFSFFLKKKKIREKNISDEFILYDNTEFLVFFTKEISIKN